MLYAALDQPAPPGGKQLNIRVNGQQFVWRFTYPNKAFAYETMVVPVDTTVTLDIESQDVAHSWWIPKLGGKFDAIPGYTNHTWFKIPASAIPRGKTGVTFRGQCTELCGYGHANMVAFVRAVPVDRYEQWVARQKREIDQPTTAAALDRASSSSRSRRSRGTVAMATSEHALRKLPRPQIVTRDAVAGRALAGGG